MNRFDRTVNTVLFSIGIAAKAAIMLHATIVAVHGLHNYYKELERWLDEKDI